MNLAAAASLAILASVHGDELEKHRNDAPPFAVAVPDAATLHEASEKTVSRVVYGYYPYWVQDLTSIRWSALTHLAWFGVELDATGAVTAKHGWPDATTVAAAHAAEVRVDLTFTLFSGSGILALSSNPARRATAIGNMVDLLQEGGADGISVDFEGLIDGTRDYFTTFIVELRAELDARGLFDAQISIAGPSVNWAGGDGIPEFDLPALLDSADYFFIMGYGYFWGGSTHAGPVGILQLSPAWRAVQSWSMLRTLATFSRGLPAPKRRQILHGVPFYGREWVTASGAMAASTVSHVGAVTYSAAQADLLGGLTRQWDEGAQTPWYAWQSGGGWHQVYYDDAESLDAKYRLILDQDLGGVGIWALNYDVPHSELWDGLETAFGAEPATPPGHRLAPLPIETTPFHDERDTRAAPGSYFDFYGCAPDVPEYGREWVYELDLCAGGTFSAHVTALDGGDPDLHLLSAPDQDSCIARDDADLGLTLAPGRYLLVVDSYVRDHVTAEGAFALDVDYVPDPASPAACAGLGTLPLEGPNGLSAGPPSAAAMAGCSCRIGGGPQSSSGLAAALALALSALARRRARV